METKKLSPTTSVLAHYKKVEKVSEAKTRLGETFCHLRGDSRDLFFVSIQTQSREESEHYLQMYEHIEEAAKSTLKLAYPFAVSMSPDRLVVETIEDYISHPLSQMLEDRKVQGKNADEAFTPTEIHSIFLELAETVNAIEGNLFLSNLAPENIGIKYNRAMVLNARRCVLCTNGKVPNEGMCMEKYNGYMAPEAAEQFQSHMSGHYKIAKSFDAGNANIYAVGMCVLALAFGYKHARMNQLALSLITKQKNISDVIATTKLPEFLSFYVIQSV